VGIRKKMIDDDEVQGLQAMTPYELGEAEKG
jgi:hypothetical protein